MAPTGRRYPLEALLLLGAGACVWAWSEDAMRQYLSTYESSLQPLVAEWSRDTVYTVPAPPGWQPSGSPAQLCSLVRLGPEHLMSSVFEIRPGGWRSRSSPVQVSEGYRFRMRDGNGKCAHPMYGGPNTFEIWRGPDSHWYFTSDRRKHASLAEAVTRLEPGDTFVYSPARFATFQEAAVESGMPAQWVQSWVEALEPLPIHGSRITDDGKFVVIYPSGSHDAYLYYALTPEPPSFPGRPGFFLGKVTVRHLRDGWYYVRWPLDK
jgi:hypothetical protein